MRAKGYRKTDRRERYEPVIEPEITDNSPPRDEAVVLILPSGSYEKLVEAGAMGAIDEQAEKVIADELFGSDTSHIRSSQEMQTLLYEILQRREYAQILGGTIEISINPVGCPTVEVVSVNEARNLALTCYPPADALADYQKWVIITLEKSKFKGDKGDDGLDGADGATGATGATGPAGPAGADGTDGATGATGATGNTGASGSDGADGNDGMGVPPVEYYDQPNKGVTYTPKAPNEITICLPKSEKVYENNGTRFQLPPLLDMRYVNQDPEIDIRGGIEAITNMFIGNSQTQWVTGNPAPAPIVVTWVALGAWGITYNQAEFPNEIASMIATIFGSNLLTDPYISIPERPETLVFPKSGEFGFSVAGIGLSCKYFRKAGVEIVNYNQIGGAINLGARMADHAGSVWRWLKKLPEEVGLHITLECFRISQPTECDLFLIRNAAVSWDSLSFGSCWQPGSILEGQRPGIYNPYTDHRPTFYLGKVNIQTSTVDATTERVAGFKVKLLTNVKDPLPRVEVNDTRTGTFVGQLQGLSYLVNDASEHYEWSFQFPSYLVPKSATTLLNGKRFYTGGYAVTLSGGNVIAGYTTRGVQFIVNASSA